MPRQLRIEYAGAIYHVMSRGARRKAIFLDDVEEDLRQRPKGDPAKIALAARPRKETTLTIGQIAQRLQMGSRNTLNNHLHQWRKTNEATVPLGKSTV